jgi:MurNAc alpha-1-phosphate uridylyltransferase
MSSDLKVAFVLAAGRGERLRPFTDSTPKPLMPIGGKPILFHTLKALVPLALDRVVINAWHLQDQIAEFVERHRRDFPFQMLVSRESELLGTGGGLKQALSLMSLPSPSATFLMMNGDVLIRGDLKAFCQRALQSTSHGYWWLAPEQKGQTVITVEGKSVVKIGSLWRAEQTSVGIMHQIHGCFSGIQVFRSLEAEKLPQKGCVIRDYWIPRLKEGESLGADSQGLDFWADIGTPDSYLALKDSLPQP